MSEFSSTAPGGNLLHLVLASDHAHLDRLVDETRSFLSDHFEDEDFIYRVVLLTTEAVTNAMDHGNHFDADKTVDLQVILHPDKVEVRVEDQGEGFDPDAVSNPLDEGNLLRDFGRGVYLIEQLADAYAYQKEGRLLWMAFNIPS